MTRPESRSRYDNSPSTEESELSADLLRFAAAVRPPVLEKAAIYLKNTCYTKSQINSGAVMFNQIRIEKQQKNYLNIR